MKYIPNNIRHLRYCKMFKQSDLAEKLGLKCADRISLWENGRAMPSVENLFDLAKILGVLPDEVSQHDTITKMIKHSRISQIELFACFI